MIQGYDPRTGKPAGEPVAETTDRAVDAIAEAAAAARPGWEAMGPAGRAAALRAVAARWTPRPLSWPRWRTPRPRWAAPG